MDVRPISLSRANELVGRLHRHADPLAIHKFALGLYREDTLIGAAIVGRPVARPLDDGLTLEISRLVTNGTRNACSKLLGAAAKAGWKAGAMRLVTYTLATESGASLRACSWRRQFYDQSAKLVPGPDQFWRFECTDIPFPARTWNMPGRARKDRRGAERWRWIKLNPVIWNPSHFPRDMPDDPPFHMGAAARSAGARFDSNPFHPFEDSYTWHGVWTSPWGEWREGWEYGYTDLSKVS